MRDMAEYLALRQKKNIGNDRLVRKPGTGKACHDRAEYHKEDPSRKTLEFWSKTLGLGDWAQTAKGDGIKLDLAKENRVNSKNKDGYNST
jgi:hypothetical protein